MSAKEAMSKREPKPNVGSEPTDPTSASLLPAAEPTALTKRDEKKGLFASRKETLDKRRPPFSEQAGNAWADRVAEFEFDLGELAMLEAAREGDDYVSDRHVQRAAEFLITRSKDKLSQTLKDVGGVTMGTGAGALLAFAATGIGGIYLAISIVLTIVGTGLFFRHGR